MKSGTRSELDTLFETLDKIKIVQGATYSFPITYPFKSVSINCWVHGRMELHINSRQRFTHVFIHKQLDKLKLNLSTNTNKSTSSTISFPLTRGVSQISNELDLLFSTLESILPNGTDTTLLTSTRKAMIHWMNKFTAQYNQNTLMDAYLFQKKNGVKARTTRNQNKATDSNDKQIHEMICEADENKLFDYLYRGGDPNFRTSWMGQSLLDSIVLSGRITNKNKLAAIRLLISYGANLFYYNERDHEEASVIERFLRYDDFFERNADSIQFYKDALLMLICKSINFPKIIIDESVKQHPIAQLIDKGQQFFYEKDYAPTKIFNHACLVDEPYTRKVKFQMSDNKIAYFQTQKLASLSEEEINKLCVFYTKHYPNAKDKHDIFIKPIKQYRLTADIDTLSVNGETIAFHISETINVVKNNKLAQAYHIILTVTDEEAMRPYPRFITAIAMRGVYLALAHPEREMAVFFEAATVDSILLLMMLMPYPLNLEAIGEWLPILKEYYLYYHQPKDVDVDKNGIMRIRDDFATPTLRHCGHSLWKSQRELMKEFLEDYLCKPGFSLVVAFVVNAERLRKLCQTIDKNLDNINYEILLKMFAYLNQDGPMPSSENQPRKSKL